MQPGEQLLQKALDVWRGPSMVITGDDDPTVPMQVLIHFCFRPRSNMPRLFVSSSLSATTCIVVSTQCFLRSAYQGLDRVLGSSNNAIIFEKQQTLCYSMVYCMTSLLSFSLSVSPPAGTRQQLDLLSARHRKLSATP